MRGNSIGNIVLVSNYESDTAYAWWLMEHFWCLLAEMYANAGRKVYLAYPKLTSVPESVAAAPVEVVEMTVLWGSGQEKATVKRFIEEKHITAIYFTDQPYFSLKYAQFRQWGVEKILVHDHTPGDRPAVNGVKGWLKSLRNQLDNYCADGVLCVSDLMRQRAIRNGRVPAEKCYLVQNGINPLKPDGRSKAEIRAMLGIPDSSFVVTTTGRAHPYKRFDFIIECASVMREKYPDVDVLFLLVGDGPVIDELGQQIAAEELEQRVRLLGFRRDIPSILFASDAALHAALGEGFSLSIVEYMGAGLPVLVPDIPSVSQAIDHGVNGYVYGPHSHDAVVEQIRTVALNRTLAGAMGGNAKRKAETVYTLDNCSEQFVQATRKLLGVGATGREEMNAVEAAPIQSLRLGR